MSEKEIYILGFQISFHTVNVIHIYIQLDKGQPFFLDLKVWNIILLQNNCEIVCHQSRRIGRWYQSTCLHADIQNCWTKCFFYRSGIRLIFLLQHICTQTVLVCLFLFFFPWFSHFNSNTYCKSTKHIFVIFFSFPFTFIPFPPFFLSYIAFPLILSFCQQPLCILQVLFSPCCLAYVLCISTSTTLHSSSHIWLSVDNYDKTVKKKGERRTMIRGGENAETLTDRTRKRENQFGRFRESAVKTRESDWQKGGMEQKWRGSVWNSRCRGRGERCGIRGRRRVPEATENEFWLFSAERK